MECPGCQQEVLSLSFYCPVCRTQLRRTSGLSLTAQEITKLEPPSPPPSRRLPFMLVAVVIVVLTSAALMTFIKVSKQAAATRETVTPSSSVLDESFVNRPATRRARAAQKQETPSAADTPLQAEPAGTAKAVEAVPLVSSVVKTEQREPEIKLTSTPALEASAPKPIVSLAPTVKEAEIKVEALDTAVDPRVGVMIIKSATRARIYINGQFSGTTPHTIRLSTGEHTVSLSADGYEDWSRKIQLRGRQQISITASLKKKAEQ